MKFQVAYSRKVTTPRQYETMSVSASMDGDTAFRNMDEAFEEIVEFVESKIAERRKVLALEAY